MTRDLPGTALDRLRGEHAVEVRTEAAPPDREELVAALGQVEGLLSLISEEIDAEVMAAAPRLRAISNYAVGSDNVDVDAATERGIPRSATPPTCSPRPPPT